MHLDSPAGRARASPAPPGRAPGAWPPTCTGSAAARRAVCTTCACFSAGEREQTRRPHVGAGVQRPSASSLTRTLVVPGPAAVRSRGTVPPCGRSGWHLVGELEGDGIAAGGQPVTRTSWATCPAIAEREKSTLERTLERKKGLIDALLQDRQPQRRVTAQHVDMRFIPLTNALELESDPWTAPWTARASIGLASRSLQGHGFGRARWTDGPTFCSSSQSEAICNIALDFAPLVRGPCLSTGTHSLRHSGAARQT